MNNIRVKKVLNNNGRIVYQAQIRKTFWKFSWWESLRDDAFGFIQDFDTIEEAIYTAKQFVNGDIVNIKTEE